MLSYMGGTVSMLAATFIVFSALSMGIAERQRTLGMLRAIGALRGQLGRLVVYEGVMLSIAGVIVGIPLGILWMHILAWRYEDVFTAGAVLSYDGLIAAAIGALITALAASLLPAINAMRASPLDAMSPLAKPDTTRGMLIAAACSLVLMSLDPLILFLPLNLSFQFYAHFTIGVGGVMLGCFLLSPMVVWLIERTLGPIVSAMFGLNFTLLRQQLSGGIWRAAGTCAALMVGLSILIVTQTQGTSAIQGWKLPERFPDLFIWSGWGLDPAEQQKLAEVPGIKKGQLMPIAIAFPEFGSNLLAIAGAAFAPDATMFFGIEPDLALEMLDLDFRQGSPDEAKRLLKLGNHIIITQEFRQLKGIGVGDTFTLKTNKGPVDFTIAGVVWSPGIDVMVGMHDMDKQFEKRTVSSLFGTIDDAREYWGVNKVRVFAANVDGPIEKADLVQRIKQHVGAWGLDAADVRQIKHGIQQALGQLLMLVSVVAYAALLVASLGVANTIMASIRSRRWQFGILRSIGVTRWQLLRIVLAEAVLLGMVGVAMGLLAGTEMAINARQSGALFVGYLPPLVIPWTTILIGTAAVMAVSVLASIWPALNVAKSEPLTLLQAGRAAV
jgi:putative ABC transport system permease protein